MEFKIVNIEQPISIRVSEQRMIILPTKMKTEKERAQFYKNNENEMIAIKFTDDEENSLEIHRTKYQTTITSRAIIKQLGIKDGKHTIRKDGDLYIFNPEPNE